MFLYNTKFQIKNIHTGLWKNITTTYTKKKIKASGRDCQCCKTIKPSLFYISKYNFRKKPIAYVLSQPRVIKVGRKVQNYKERPLYNAYLGKKHCLGFSL